MQEGSIFISAKLTPESEYVSIWLDLPTHTVVKSESIDLLRMTDESLPTDKRKAGLSPSMKLLLNQKLLTVMGGKLEILPSPESHAAEQLTRLELSIPLTIPEAELL